jgi:hypothetical protein
VRKNSIWWDAMTAKVCQNKSARQVEVKKSHGCYNDASTEKQTPQTGWGQRVFAVAD